MEAAIPRLHPCALPGWKGIMESPCCFLFFFKEYLCFYVSIQIINLRQHCLESSRGMNTKLQAHHAAEHLALAGTSLLRLTSRISQCSHTLRNSLQNCSMLTQLPLSWYCNLEPWGEDHSFFPSLSVQSPASLDKQRGLR